jgi:hypothetical protein
MWRNVGTLGHVAQVAQIALIDYVPVVFPFNAVQFPGFSPVYQIEQSGKCRTQANAPTATVTNVIDAIEFLGKRFFVVEIS